MKFKKDVIGRLIIKVYLLHSIKNALSFLHLD